jgi:hypothetical protein
MDVNTVNPETPAIDITMDSSWPGVERRSEARMAEDIPARMKVLDPMVSLCPKKSSRDHQQLSRTSKT